MINPLFVFIKNLNFINFNLIYVNFLYLKFINFNLKKIVIMINFIKKYFDFIKSIVIFHFI